MSCFEETWYKTSGAFRLSGKVYREAWGVWLELATAFSGSKQKAKSTPKYDWANKLVFKLSRDDLGKLGAAFDRTEPGELLNLIHRHQESNKTLKIALAQNGNYFINGFHQIHRVSIPLEPDAVWKLRICLKAAYEGSLCR